MANGEIKARRFYSDMVGFAVCVFYATLRGENTLKMRNG
jgi:hypothetical protein